MQTINLGSVLRRLTGELRLLQGMLLHQGRSVGGALHGTGHDTLPLNTQIFCADSRGDSVLFVKH